MNTTSLNNLINIFFISRIGIYRSIIQKVDFK